jgi:hypothetical protein
MKIGGFEIPELLEFHGKKLKLNGAGMRNKFFIDIYALALYADKSITSSAEAVSGTTPRAIRLVITAPIVTNQLVTQSMHEGMKKAAGKKFKLIEPYIDEMIRVFNAHTIKTGDYFDIVYFPKEGMSVYRNGVFATGPQHNEDLRDAVFGNWLGDHPRDLRLKRNMLKGF